MRTAVKTHMSKSGITRGLLACMALTGACWKLMKAYGAEQRELLRERCEAQAARKSLARQAEELAGYRSIQEVRTVSGLMRKGNVYLIRSTADLKLLAGAVRSGAEIEPGRPAGQAHYRLTGDLILTGSGWNPIGTGEHPFAGWFDGDGHVIEGRFKALFPEGEGAGRLFGMCSESARIENLEVRNRFMDGDPKLIRRATDASFQADLSGGRLSVTVESQEQCEELTAFLSDVYRCGSLEIVLKEEGIDTKALARLTGRRKQGDVTVTWERRDGDPEQTVPVCLKSFVEKIEEDRALNTQALRPGKQLYRVRRERIRGLCCETYEYMDSAYQEPNHSSHCVVRITGRWLTHRDLRQVLEVPDMDDLGNCTRRFSVADINFDGYPDLLFSLGTSSGSGGSWRHYKGFIWREEKRRFEYFPTLPERFIRLEPEERRIVSRYRSGWSLSGIDVYELVKGQFVLTRELQVAEDLSGNGYVRYYESGRLIEETYVDPQNAFKEASELYPDLNYWPACEEK